MEHDLSAFLIWFVRVFATVFTGVVGLALLVACVRHTRVLFTFVRQTFKSAFRYRLFWVLLGLVVVSVVGLPLLLKDDGTARGFIQIMLTYTLSVITVQLGLATLWLGCGSLARDIEECQIQMVAVKPVGRWQIWLGKWLGITLLNATLLAFSGLCIYGLLQWRAARLPEAQREILRNEIFLARGSLKEAPPDLEGDVQLQMEKMPNRQSLSPAELQEARNRLKQRVQALYQVVPPDHLRRWTVDLGPRRLLLQDQALYLRVKFFAAATNAAGTYLGLWQVGPPNSSQARSVPQSLAANTFHEIKIPPNLFDEDGKLTVEFINRNNEALIFPLQDGFEVLYREGGFGLNFIRGLSIILCWLALLAALGLAAASLLSFPVASFFSISILVVALSSGTLSSVVQEGSLSGPNHETGEVSRSPIDMVLLPLFRGLLAVVDVVQQHAPVDALSTGRSITWTELGSAFGEIVLFLGGLLALTGMVVLTRRELALPSGHS